ncbi:MAG: hypothetical protein ACRC3Z_06320 [Phocaeicola sp.]
MNLFKKTVFGSALTALVFSLSACSDSSSNDVPEVPVITGYELTYELSISEDVYGAADYTVTTVVDGVEKVEKLETSEIKDVVFATGTHKCRVWTKNYTSKTFPGSFEASAIYDLHELTKESYTVVFYKTKLIYANWSDGKQTKVASSGEKSVNSVSAANLTKSLDLKMKQLKTAIEIELNDEKNEITVK